MTGKEFAKLCRDTAEMLEALAQEGDRNTDIEVGYCLKYEPAALKALLAVPNAILGMKSE